ncbi:MAG: sigma-70 family RNA polymerase sigma factor [Bacteroidetes bacterium]|nr:MAG: sigma-70 family RNA polymerase sigma factor [Bacteroidota bacterium]
MEQIPDSKILELLNGDNPNYGFNLLMKKYKQPLYYTIRQMVIIHEDADDILQNVFIKVWKNIHTFKKEAKLYTWLYRIAVNETLNFLNAKKRRFFLPIHDYNKELSAKISQDPLFSGDDIQKLLQKAILQLPDKQRLVFNMKYFQEMKYEEIAEILGTSVGALKANYHHAVKKIEEFLSGELNH